MVYEVIPKGFFPQQDTGLIQGETETTPDVSYAAMSDRERHLIKLAGSDPAVEVSYGWIGPDPTESQGRVLIALKPFSERRANAEEVMRRLKKRIAKLDDITLHMQSRQDLRVGAHTGQNQYLYILEDADLTELQAWAPKVMKAMRALPQLSEVDTDQQLTSEQVTVEIDRLRASELGIAPQAVDDILYDAFRTKRQVATIYKANSQERGGDGGRSASQCSSTPRPCRRALHGGTFHDLGSVDDHGRLDHPDHPGPPRRLRQPQVRGRAADHRAPGPASGPVDFVPGLAPNVSLGAAVDAIDAAKAAIGAPLTPSDRLSGPQPRPIRPRWLPSPG